MKENESTVDICTEAHAYIIGKIKKEHPEWIEKDGACLKCIDYYEKL